MTRQWCRDVTSLEAADCMLAHLCPEDGATLEKLLEHSRASARVYRIVARLDSDLAADAKARARREAEASKILSAFLNKE